MTSSMWASLHNEGRHSMQFTASVYEHAAKLIGRTPWDVSRNGDILCEAHAEAFRVYEHSPVVVGIDIYNLEAEAYGAIVGKPEGSGIPAITGHVCGTTSDISLLEPLNPTQDGRIPMVIETGRRLKQAFPKADVRIPVSGPFSLAANLAGLDRLLCDIVDDPKAVTGASSSRRGSARVLQGDRKSRPRRGLLRIRGHSPADLP
jgi:hypothetical protein